MKICSHKNRRSKRYNRQWLYLAAVLFLLASCGSDNQGNHVHEPLVLTAGANSGENSLGNQEVQPYIPPVFEDCKLIRTTSYSVALGFPRVEGIAPTLGEVNMTVLFVDFFDTPANTSTQDVLAILDPIAADFLTETSYGRMQLNLHAHHEWLRLKRTSRHYGRGLAGGDTHLAFIQEAVDLADAQVDFSETDIVLVVANPEASAIAYGPTYISPDPRYGILADGVEISSGITSGFDLNYWGGIWLAHEIGHTLGLPDLYRYSWGAENSFPHPFVGTFSLMGDTESEVPGYLAFERWSLGWLDDSQMHCHETGDVIVDLDSITTPGGVKAVVTPLSSTTALVAESRRAQGFDRNLEKEGVLVYVVDTKFATGYGTIRVKPGVDTGDMMRDAPMEVGDTYTYKGVTVRVMEQNANGDRVQVTIN